MLADTSWSWRGLGAAELEVELRQALQGERN